MTKSICPLIHRVVCALIPGLLFFLSACSHELYQTRTVIVPALTTKGESQAGITADMGGANGFSLYGATSPVKHLGMFLGTNILGGGIEFNFGAGVYSRITPKLSCELYAGSGFTSTESKKKRTETQGVPGFGGHVQIKTENISGKYTRHFAQPAVVYRTDRLTAALSTRASLVNFYQIRIINVEDDSEFRTVADRGYLPIFEPALTLHVGERSRLCLQLSAVLAGKEVNRISQPANIAVGATLVIGKRE